MAPASVNKGLPSAQLRQQRRRLAQQSERITELENTVQQLQVSAEYERELRRWRQQQGIAAAKAQGVRFGRPAKDRPPEFQAMKEQWLCGDISAREAARRLDIHHKTFLEWVRK